MGQGDSSSFGVKMGEHKDSVLTPLLSASVVDVVMKEARGGLPWELLDLILVATTKEELRRKLVAKRLKVNVGKMKVMVSSGETSDVRVWCMATWSL